MKKYTKEIVLVLITAIVVSVISVSATVYFNSENITFEPDDTNWNVSSTSSALNDLYSYANSGDATASNILLGKTALVNGTLITGTMVDNGAVTSTLNAGGSYTIPAGYHNGNGKVTAINTSNSDSSKFEVIKKWYGTSWNRTKTSGTVSFTTEKKGTYILVAGGNNVVDNYSYITCDNFEAKGENVVAERLDGTVRQADHTTMFIKECEANETHTFTWYITAWNNVGGLEVTLIYVP